MKIIKKIFPTIPFFLLGFCFSLFFSVFAFAENDGGGNGSNVSELPVSAKGIVLRVDTVTKSTKDIDFTMDHQDANAPPDEMQKVTLQMASGDDYGKTITIENDLKHNPFDIIVKPGDKVFLYGEKHDGKMEYYIRDYWHLDALLFWVLILIALVVWVGKWKGVKAIFTLGLSFSLLFSWFIPALQNGGDPIFLSVGVSLVIAVVTLPLIHGFSGKALVSIIGTFGGIAVASTFSWLMIIFSRLNGLGTEDMRLFAANNPGFHFQGILFAGILIGALGAIMDVAVSISAGLQEIREHKPHIQRAELILSGMNIGKDILGSMLSTLIFAYMGTSMAIILIISQGGISFTEFFNYDFVAEEMVRSFVGSLGLLATIPLTAVSAGVLHDSLQKRATHSPHSKKVLKSLL